MRGIIIHLLSFFILSFSQNLYHVYFNEIRADDASTDDIEFIELIGPAGLDLSGFTIIHYNGNETSDADIWQHTIGTFTIPDDGIVDDHGGPIGFYVLAALTVPNRDETLPASIQNGPDGLVLHDPESNILDAIAWEGSGDLATDDPGTVSTSVSITADNYLHVTIDDDALDNSLQAPSVGYADDGSGWLLGAATPGALNFNQVNGDISLPVELTSFTVTGYEDQIQLKWKTASEMDNAGFMVFRSDDSGLEYQLISSFRSNLDLIGLGNSSVGRDYSFLDSDPTLSSDKIYFYKIADVDYSGNRNYFGPVEANLSVTEAEHETINNFYLHQNYPNPFNPATEIKVSLDKPVNHAEIEVFDASGKRIRGLYSGPAKGPTLTVSWDGKDGTGAQVASGCYFYRYHSENRTLMKKMMLIR